MRFLLCSIGSFVLAVAANASAAPAPVKVPAALAVRGVLGPAPAGVADVKFAQMYRLPVGPAGLEPSERLRALAGKRVRLVGYMVQRATPQADVFLLSPLPVSVGDDDDGLADDVPASAVAVHLPAKLEIPNLPGLLRITGTLELGAREDAASGRVLGIHLVPDADSLRALRSVAAAPARSARP